MKILWAITGAGHLLKESIDVLEKISVKHEITLTYTPAAKEVIELYGLDKNIKEILSNNPKNKIITEEEQRFSYPFSGKITHHKYDLVVISPLTANTTAKIVCGIADNLVTNIVAQSAKGQIPALAVPVDQKEGVITTIIPPYIDKKLCNICGVCINECTFNAIKPPEIDMQKCTSCKKCEDICPNNAIKIGEKLELYIRKLDADNAQKLGEIENINVVNHPYDVLVHINRLNKKKELG